MKTFNTILSIFAVLAIVALSAFNTHKVEEQAKVIAELQQYHQYDVIVDTTDTFEIYDNNIWESVDDAIKHRNEDLEWISIVEQWRNMPEISLRHILQHHGLHLGIKQIVEIYNSNIDYYRAYEEGYLTPKLPDAPTKKVKPEKKMPPVEQRPQHDSLLNDFS